MRTSKSISETQLAAGIAHGEQERRTSPHATAIRFEPRSRMYTLTLLAGAEVSFSAESVNELAGATLAQLTDVQLSPSGGGISWPQLDMDIDTTGLVMDLVAGEGWRATYRALLVREISGSRSEAKAAAARENGTKGGRPRKQTIAEVAPSMGKVARKPRHTSAG